jgi:hypothetical protein
MVKRLNRRIDTFDGAKPRFLNRGKKRRSVSTLSPSIELRVLSFWKGIALASDRGVEWVDLTSSYHPLAISSFGGHGNPWPLPTVSIGSIIKSDPQH